MSFSTFEVESHAVHGLYLYNAYMWEGTSSKIRGQYIYIYYCGNGETGFS